MVELECPNSSMSTPDGPFSDFHKAGVPLSLCVYLEDEGISFKGTVWTARQSKTRFLIIFFLGPVQVSSYGYGSKQED